MRLLKAIYKPSEKLFLKIKMREKKTERSIKGFWKDSAWDDESLL